MISKLKHLIKKSYAAKIVLLFFMFILCIFMTGIVYMGIQLIQEMLFVPEDYLAFGMSDSGNKLVLIFEVEFIIIFSVLIAKAFKLFRFEKLMSIITNKRKRIRYVAGAVVVNILLLLLCIVSVTVVANDGIYVRNIRHVNAKHYEFNQVEKVLAGYHTEGRKKGIFYYTVVMDDTKNIELMDCAPKESDSIHTYTWLETVDQYIMENHVVKVVDQVSKKDKYDYAKRYIDTFERIMKNGTKGKL